MQKVKRANAQRQQSAPGNRFVSDFTSTVERQEHPELSINYIVSPSRITNYMAHNAKIYEVYIKYIALDDIHSC